MKNLQTIILAAGKGTRMKSDVPKVLHHVCGQPIIQYVLDVAKNVGCEKTFVVVGHQSEVLREYLGQKVEVVQQEKLLGTAEAVKCVAPKFKSFSGDVLILCGDTPLLNTNVIKNIIKKHKKSGAVCTFLTAIVHDPQGYGRIIRDVSGSVVAIREDKDADGLEKNIAEINVGVYCFKSQELFKGLQDIKVNKKKNEFYLTDLIEQFNSQEKLVGTVETEDSCEGLGINTRVDLAQAQLKLNQHILKKFMLSGVTIIDPSSTQIDAKAKIGKDTVIKPFTVIENNVTIGAHCTIGPFARIRPGVKIDNDVQIGNFTEVSRTSVGKKTMVKHFSFLGDAVIGKNVNVGAGVVTANYDGVQKSKTKISDGAFIGSDAVLVAPVSIGKNAVVGAGTVLPKGRNVPNDGLAMGIPARISKKDKR